METAFYTVRVEFILFSPGPMKVFEYNFDDESKTLLELKKEAAEKAIFLSAIIRNEIPQEKVFESFTDAERYAFSSYYAFSIDIMFKHDGQIDFIYGGDPADYGNGEKSSAYYGLESESNYYKKNYTDAELAEVERINNELRQNINLDDCDDDYEDENDYEEDNYQDYYDIEGLDDDDDY